MTKLSIDLSSYLETGRELFRKDVYKPGFVGKGIAPHRQALMNSPLSAKIQFGAGYMALPIAAAYLLSKKLSKPEQQVQQLTYPARY